MADIRTDLDPIDPNPEPHPTPIPPGQEIITAQQELARMISPDCIGVMERVNSHSDSPITRPDLEYLCDKLRLLARLDVPFGSIDPHVLHGEDTIICDEYDCHVWPEYPTAGILNNELYFSNDTWGIIMCEPWDTNCHSHYTNGAGAFASQGILGSEWSCPGYAGDSCSNIDKLHDGCNYVIINVLPESMGDTEYCHPAFGCTGFNNGTGLILPAGGTYDQLAEGADMAQSMLNGPHLKLKL